MKLQITIGIDEATASDVDAIRLIDLQFAADMAVINAISAMRRLDVDQWGPCKTMIGGNCGDWRVIR